MRYSQTLIGAAAMLLPLCSSSFGQLQCSLSTVRGTWTYQGRGTVMMMSTPGSSGPLPVPVAGLGIAKIGDQGNYSLHATLSVGGQVQDVDYSGSISVNPDCTATATYKSGAYQGTDRLVILDYGNTMNAMPVQFPLGPFSGVFYLRRLAWHEARCTAAMVRGLYGGPREGTQMIPAADTSPLTAVPFSAIHTATFDGRGAGKAASTASLGGAIVDFEMPTLSIAVNPDCTATMTYIATSTQFPGLTFTGAVRYIVLNNGNELIGMDTEASPGLPGVVLDNLKRISMAPVVSIH